MSGIVQLAGALMIIIGIALFVTRELGVPFGVIIGGVGVMFIGLTIETIELLRTREVSNGNTEDSASRTGQATRYTSSDSIDTA